MAPVKVEITMVGSVNSRRLNRMVNGGLDRAAYDIVHDVSETLVGLLIQYAPKTYGTGNNPHEESLSDSIYKVRDGSLNYTVKIGAAHAIFVVGGTKPHPIVATGNSKFRITAVTRKSIRSRIASLEKQHLKMIEGNLGSRVGQQKITFQERERRRRRSDEIEDKLVELEDALNAPAHRSIPRLIFQWDKAPRGTFVGGSVRHPGSKPNNFMDKARRKAASDMGRRLRDMMDRAG